MNIFRSLVDLVDTVVLGVLTFLRILITGIGRFITFLFFGVLIAGVLYYYVKGDLPPQELREIGNETFPAEFSRLSDFGFLEKVFPLFDIDPNLPTSDLPVQNESVPSIIGDDAVLQ